MVSPFTLLPGALIQQVWKNKEILWDIPVDDKIVQQYLISLPSRHPTVRKLIYEKHQKLCHGEVQTVLCCLRENYWIVQGRRAVKAAIRKCVKWIFIPPGSPWWGERWKRLVELLEKLMKRVLGKTTLSYEDMTTVLCECESVVDSRPLTYVYNNCEELTAPAMFTKDLVEDGMPDLDKILTSFLQNIIDSWERRRDTYSQITHPSEVITKPFQRIHFLEVSTDDQITQNIENVSGLPHVEEEEATPLSLVD
ncbi:hypothetical protein ILUMI_25728 [Ignelater luminosus]|uniref:Uncharacterized protein n=1 Tax=Ignelater luminosus TaxID=2038154 RepID=A0A8K0CB47_IGNLU|nr:hypothetical protein ILUMI_25728 [Ignelater luminosus]